MLCPWPWDIALRAKVVYPYIFYQDMEDPVVRRHEWKHIEQIQKDGWLRYHLIYLVYNYWYGYEHNPYEREAKEVEYDEDYKPWSKHGTVKRSD